MEHKKLSFWSTELKLLEFVIQAFAIIGTKREVKEVSGQGLPNLLVKVRSKMFQQQSKYKYCFNVLIGLPKFCCDQPCRIFPNFRCSL